MSNYPFQLHLNNTNEPLTNQLKNQINYYPYSRINFSYQRLEEGRLLPFRNVGGDSLSRLSYTNEKVNDANLIYGLDYDNNSTPLSLLLIKIFVVIIWMMLFYWIIAFGGLSI
ncbi:5889_t:CDS:1 [Acaulospora morrowiae]|uniref:5889_t:CDS:1 n=1 Tax=Acaulospora morrowiae TaxID=94023 RepID=A0A9N9BG90_9GLOM|nr:5889_t:CDS:1 [Acaulospora morrowiae]